MVSTGSSFSKLTVKAPCRRAIARRSSCGSTAITWPAPIISALVIANCPTGPQPNTATVSPRLISAISAPNQPVGKISLMRIACSSVTPSGIFTKVFAANGMRAFSACKPSIGPVACGPPKKQVPACEPLGLALSHCAVLPLRQGGQYPQDKVEQTTTLSPISKFLT